MAKSRRAQRRERRTYKKWLWKEQLRKLRRTEEQILGIKRPTKFKVEWEVRGPGIVGSELLLGVDFAQGVDDTVVITGTKESDGTYTITPSTPGKYMVTARIS